MGDIDIKRISPLKRRIKLLEGAMLTCVGGMALAFYQEEDMVGYYLAFLFGVLYIWKYYTLLQLDKRQFLANVVEQRTIELRSQRDAIRAESQKLSNALTKLAEAQDELVRKERMASIGQLTKGLVDRILNPLNYINNFGRLSMSLIEDLEHNVEADHKAGDTINYEDSRELLSMLSDNMTKIVKHGDSTVRIVKAMEEILKEQMGTCVPVEVNELCRANVALFEKRNVKQLRELSVEVSTMLLSTSIKNDLSVGQIGKMFQALLDNSLYAIGRKKYGEGDRPEIRVGLSIEANNLRISIWDNGIGMDEVVREQAFSPFFTTRSTAEAAGVGLYLCREVVMNHKGTIRLESVKDEFTEVVILLPIY